LTSFSASPDGRLKDVELPGSLTRRARTLGRVNLDANQASIREACDNGLLAGAVTLVWQGGKVLQVNEIGFRDVDAKLPMQRDTIFRIASMSKPVTIAAAMTLVDEGRITLADPITRWLPEFSAMRVLAQPRGALEATVPASRPITVLDLMTHRSGLAYPFSVLGPLARAYGKLPHRQEQDRWLAELVALPLAHQPGERLTYSVATDVLGILLSRVAGKPLHEVLQERILGPLGMTDTGFFVTPAGRRRAATMYKLDETNTLTHDVMGPPPIAPPPFCQGGAGLWSTADDYLKFIRMLLGFGEADGVRVVSEESVRLMRTDQLTEEQRAQPFLGMPFWEGRGFGLNLSLVTDPAKATQLYGPGGRGAFSWPGAFGTWWQADPENDLILMYLIQNLPNLTADAAAIGGNTSQAKLQTAQPRFVRRTYQALQR
jgi:CubicO group peptidase (beta-lactamase class C family)